jgi:predicted Fe-Mo cluster-binding NifX family protein
MKIALPIWNYRVSPVFDVARHVLVVEAGPRQLRLQRRQSLPMTDPVARAQTLVNWDVEVLICGAISQALERLLKSGGVSVISGVRGEVTAVVEAYLGGRLDDAEFAMPGCHVAANCGRGTRPQPAGDPRPT